MTEMRDDRICVCRKVLHTLFLHYLHIFCNYVEHKGTGFKSLQLREDENIVTPNKTLKKGCREIKERHRVDIAKTHRRRQLLIFELTWSVLIYTLSASSNIRDLCSLF